MTTHDSPAATHRQCDALLPWLVNGTLSTEARRQVEAHLATCEQCRAEVAEQELLQEHMAREDSVLYAPQPSLQKMMSRIDADTIAVPDRVDVDRRIVRGAGRGRVTWPLARAVAATFVVGAVAIAAAASVLAWRASDERQAARYSTLTSGPVDALTVPAARVVFAPTTSVARLNELLRRHQARVVAGPTEAGVYTLTFTAPATASIRASGSGHEQTRADIAGDTVRDLDASITALRTEPDVLFAEPVLASTAR